MKCAEKVFYPTIELADAALKHFVKTARDRQAAKRLVVYPCRDCKQYHIGHVRPAYNKTVEIPNHKTSAKNVPTFGQLRRKLNRLEAHWDAANRRRAEALAQMVALDTALSGQPR